MMKYRCFSIEKINYFCDPLLSTSLCFGKIFVMEPIPLINIFLLLLTWSNFKLIKMLHLFFFMDLNFSKFWGSFRRSFEYKKVFYLKFNNCQISSQFIYYLDLKYFGWLSMFFLYNYYFILIHILYKICYQDRAIRII